MKNLAPRDASELEATEQREWIDSLDYVIQQGDRGRVQRLLATLRHRARMAGVALPFTAVTAYVNTIRPEDETPLPGSQEIERRIKSLVRWNAMAMVVRANRLSDGIGGHISTYASAATLYEVAFNHFFRGKGKDGDGDIIYFQGHASPGIYARAYLEGRISLEKLQNFRQELAKGGGLSSYPHPWLMPDFWEFPTVSMGLGPIMSIYQARFNRYLEDRGLRKPSPSRVWAFLGDGETDEPESLGAISLAAREKLDNLTFVINCNLQRLDGPVRGNGQIVQELEAIFRGAGWNVIKVMWGSDWDPLLAKDHDGLLAKRMGEVVDGQYQKYAVESGAYLREHFFGVDPRLLDMVKHLSDDQLKRLRLGGHDPVKVYNAYKTATEHKGQPTVILARTIKGYGLGEAGEGKNITHQQKKMNESDLRSFRTRFGIPISDEEIADAPFYRPPDDSTELQYLRERRKALGGFVPTRSVRVEPLTAPIEPIFEEFYKGTEGRKASTTMVFVRMLSKLLRDKEVGDLIVPIVPDEARTFGMESLFRAIGIYSHVGQKYEPVDMDTLLYYKEAQDDTDPRGRDHGGGLDVVVHRGRDRVCDARHQHDSVLHLLLDVRLPAGRRPDLGRRRFPHARVRPRRHRRPDDAGGRRAAAPGRAEPRLFGLGAELHLLRPGLRLRAGRHHQDGIRRMYREQESIFYYLTVMNEQYEMPPMPDGAREGILKGMYRFSRAENSKAKLKAQLLGSGAILNQVSAAQKLLEKYDVAADVWSVTSYQELYRDGHAVDRWNMLHPGETPKVPYVTSLLKDTAGVIVAASDYLKILPDSIDRWMPRKIRSLGTDGFGRSEDRADLRSFFEVDARFIALATLAELAQEGQLDRKVVAQAMKDFGIDPDKPNPARS